MMGGGGGGAGMSAASLPRAAAPIAVPTGGGRRHLSLSFFASPKLLAAPNLSPKGLGARSRGSGLRRNSSSNSRTPASSPGENDSKTVLEAFFLGKAFAEALNERIESTVGEILSVVGRWQAEQQKQVLDFQDEVIERSKKAKEKAALQAMEEQGVISKSLIAPSNGATSTVSVSPQSPEPSTEDPLQEMLNN